MALDVNLGLLAVWALLVLVPVSVGLYFSLVRIVPRDFVIVRGDEIYPPGRVYFLWGSDVEEQKWQIQPQQASFETPRGAYVISWVPRIDRFLAFVSTGGDDAVRAKFAELLAGKTEMLAGEWKFDERKGLFVVPDALGVVAFEMGVHIRTYFPPAVHKPSDLVRANIEDALRTGNFQCNGLMEVKRMREKFFAEHAKEIKEYDDKQEYEDRKLATMINEFFDNMEQSVRAGRLRVDEVDPNRWP